MTGYLLRKRNLILSLWITFLFLSAFSIFWHIKKSPSPIDNSVGVWFMTDDEELKVYERYNKDFGYQEWTILMIETKSIYNPGFLSELSDIVKRIEILEHVIKVNSIVNIRDNELTSDGALNYKRIYHPDGKNILLTQGEVEVFKKSLKMNPIFDTTFFKSNDDTHTVIMIQNDNLIGNQGPYRIKLIDDIRDILAQHSTIDLYSIAGTTVVNAELNRASLRDVYVFYTLIIIMVVAFGAITLRNIKDIVILLAVVVGSIIPTMGFISFWGISFNMVTVMIPTVLVALSVADAVHTINDFHIHRSTENVEKTISQTLQDLWKPMLWTSITTVVGFVSLTTSTVVPIVQLGIFTSFGIIIAWLTTVVIVPQLLLRFWAGTNKKMIKEGLSFSDRIPEFIARNRRTLSIAFAILTLPCFGLFYMEVDTNYTKFFDDSTDMTRAYDDIAKAGFAQNPITITFDLPEDFVYGEKFHDQIVAFEDRIKELPEVIKLLSLTDLMKEVDKVFNGPDLDGSKYSKYSANQISQLLLLAELSGNTDIYDFLNEEKTKFQLIAMTPYLSSKELGKFREKVENIGHTLLPKEIRPFLTGTTVLWSNMDEQISETQLFSLLIIGVFLAFFLPAVFGSLRIGLLGVFVNLMPLGVTLGVMSLLGIKINMATALIGGIALGVVVDDTIHLINRIRLNALRGLDWQRAVDNAVASVGKSIVMTSVILIAGFLCMTTSNFLPSAHFGLLISLSVIIALFIDLFILPMILKTTLFTPSFAKTNLQEHPESQIFMQFKRGK